MSNSSTNTPGTPPNSGPRPSEPMRTPNVTRQPDEDYPLSPPDYGDYGGLSFNVQSLLHHRGYGSHDQLHSPSASDASSHSEEPLGNHIYINKLLSLDPYSNRIKKGSSMVTIPESSSLVTQARERGIGAIDPGNANFLYVKSPVEQTNSLTTSPIGGPPPIPRCASAGQLPIVDLKKTPDNPNQKYRTIPGSSSPNVTHRDLNQFAPLHF